MDPTRPHHPASRVPPLLLLGSALALLAACEQQQRTVGSNNPWAGSQYDRAVVTMPQDYRSARRRSSPIKAVGDGLEGLGEKLFGWMRRDGGTKPAATRTTDPAVRESGAHTSRSSG